MPYAHSKNERGLRQDLVSHLTSVAASTKSFAQPFAPAETAHFLGLWHDIGKFSTQFQEYLQMCETGATLPRGPDHKAAGAWLASRYAGPAALLLQGHHGGLQNLASLRAWLAQKNQSPEARAALEAARAAIVNLEPSGPLSFPQFAESDPLAAELFLRILFSALVDADFLDTERHFAPEASGLRGCSLTIEELWQRLQQDQKRFDSQSEGPVARARRAVYEACLHAATGPPGFFRLTVPTGGGKTRSGMAFALAHARQHGLARVIVAVPFISITEQTADVYRSIFGADAQGRPAVLEHHSEAFLADGDEDAPAAIWARLAAENWDAPIVVTTTVQLFESLFANSTRRCRKLHRLARSVIILDEAQALPPPLLTPIVDALRELCAHYGATVVLSTATQPAFEAIPTVAGLEAREIVPQPETLFQKLRRVDYEWRTQPALAWTEVAELMRQERQSLAVVNTKRDAFALLDALSDPEALHLSTTLCGAHRRRVIGQVKQALAAGKPCRLVSTQVIEAGVDIDFPLVLRAAGPLDAIIQSAGRCNREGRLARGKVIVFQPQEGGMPAGPYRIGYGVTGVMLGKGALDPDDPAQARAYFKSLFEMVDTDREGIQAWRQALDYPEVARRFHLIDDAGESVVVPFGSPEEQREVERTIDMLRAKAGNPRLLLRRLQPYLVSLRSRQAQSAEYRSLLAPVLPGVWQWLGNYDRVRGLTGEGPDIDALVV